MKKYGRTGTWCRPGEQPHLIERNKTVPKVLVWAAVKVDEPPVIIIMEENITAESYVEKILKPFFAILEERKPGYLMTEDYYFQQDGAS